MEDFRKTPNALGTAESPLVEIASLAKTQPGVSVYGLGRFPVTLYYEQWIRLLDSADELRTFLEENKGKLKLKDERNPAG